MKDTEVAAPTIRTSTGRRAINDGASVTVGNIEAGANWDYSLDGGATWTPGSALSIAGSALSEGTHRVTVRQTDASGNQASATAEVVKDTQVGLPTVATRNGTGFVNRGEYLTLGNIEEGASVAFSLNGGTTWIERSVIGTHTWAEGTNHLTVRQIDPAGNQATTTAELEVIASISSPSVRTSTGKRVINESGSVMVGNIQTGARWDYSLDDGRSWTPGSGSSIASSALSEGLNQVIVRKTDGAGNPSTMSIGVVKDTVALAPTLTLASDTGEGGDRLTNDGSLSVGGIEPLATWEYSIDGGGWLVGGPAGIADPGFTDGAHNVRARQTDAVGNSSQETELNFSIDKSAPDRPGLFLNADSGVVGDRIVRSASLRVLGTEIGGTTHVSVDGALQGTTPNDADTTLIDMDGQLSEGARSIGVQQVDAAGNASDWTFINVTIDRTAPDAAFTGLSGSGLAITSDEGGEVFLVRDTLSPADDLADIDTLDASSWRRFASAGPGNETSLADLSGLRAGTYDVYARDGAGNATQIASPLSGTGTGPLKAAIGSAGSDVISLPDGGGVMVGNGGADRFVFEAGQTGTFVFTDIDDEIIRGEADMDIIDLTAVLKNYTAPSSGDDAANDLFLTRVDEAGKSTIFVDVDGNGDFQNAELVLVLTGPAAQQFVQLATPGEVLMG
ncbi:hypothetical protein ABE85_02225 [Mitsuaria sp. 7]|nr:hypothetical protein ABE85_02225 [Mitsuaria sp. 7]